jgi:hypothetical protein
MHRLKISIRAVLTLFLLLSLTALVNAQAGPTILNTTWQAELATFNAWYAKERAGTRSRAWTSSCTCSIPAWPRSRPCPPGSG